MREIELQGQGLADALQIIWRCFLHGSGTIFQRNIKRSTPQTDAGSRPSFPICMT
jgi:hypothetical protein